MIRVEDGIYKAPLHEVMGNLNATPQKFSSVLNLETHTREIMFGDANDLFRECLDKHVTLYDMAWSGLFPPKTIDVLYALRVLILADKPIVFGCRAARERAGYLLAVYRIRYQGYTFQEAYDEWKAKGCRWPTYWLWKRSLKKWEHEK